MHAPTPGNRRFSSGLIGGCVGATAVLMVMSLSQAFGPGEASGSQQVINEERAVGFVSAAEQRKQIIDRLDRVLGALERIDRRLQDGASDVR